MDQGVGIRSFIERCVEYLREKLLETMDKTYLGLIEGLERAYEKREDDGGGTVAAGDICD